MEIAGQKGQEEQAPVLRSHSQNQHQHRDSKGRSSSRNSRRSQNRNVWADCSGINSFLGGCCLGMGRGRRDRNEEEPKIGMQILEFKFSVKNLSTKIPNKSLRIYEI